MSGDLMREALQTTAQCVSLEELATMDAAAVAAHPHVAACPRCRTELELMQVFREGDDRLEVSSVANGISERLRARRQPAKGWWQRSGVQRLAMAASVAAILVSSAVLMQRRAPELPSGLGGEEVVYRSGSIQLSGPAGDVDAVPGLLEWKPISGAARYSVRLLEVDQTEIWKGVSAKTGIELPPAIRQKVLPGKTLLWQVTALDGRGTSIASSPLERFRVRVKQ